MAVARAANAPQLTLLRDPPAPDVAPVVRQALPRPRAEQWQASRSPARPVARWLGIGGCVLLFGWLLATVLTEPISAEIERLFGPWQEWQQDREAAATQTDPALPAPPARVAGQDEPEPAPMPVLAREDLGAPAEPDSAPAGAVAEPAADDAPARSVPLPAFKPRPADR